MEDKEINYTDEDLVDHHVVVAVIRDSDGNILMQDHVKCGVWTLPVGKVKPGQSFIEGAKEEVLEECNLVINDLKEIIYREKDYNRKGKVVNTKVHVYDVLDYSGEMKNNEPHKHNDQKFLPLEEIKKIPHLSDVTIFFLESLGFERSALLE